MSTSIVLAQARGRIPASQKMAKGQRKWRILQKDREGAPEEEIRQAQEILVTQVDPKSSNPREDTVIWVSMLCWAL